MEYFKQGSDTVQLKKKKILCLLSGDIIVE